MPATDMPVRCRIGTVLPVTADARCDDCHVMLALTRASNCLNCHVIFLQLNDD